MRSTASINKKAVKTQMMNTDMRAARTSARWYPKEWRLVAGCSDSQIAINETMKLITSCDNKSVDVNETIFKKQLEFSIKKGDCTSRRRFDLQGHVTYQIKGGKHHS